MRRNNAEQIGEMIRKFFRQNGLESPLNEYRLVQAWKEVVGPAITKYTSNLFSTKSKIYLVDRNGVMVSGYPLKLTTQCNQGITLCDYDKNRNYRIFVPRSDKRIELFDIEGKKVSGWQSPILKSAPVTRVKHFRVGGKDYIVVADKSKLYIFDRKGNVRVNCNKVFNLSGATVLTLEKYKGQNVISVKDGAKKAIYINFIGKEVQ